MKARPGDRRSLCWCNHAIERCSTGLSGLALWWEDPQRSGPTLPRRNHLKIRAHMLSSPRVCDISSCHIALLRKFAAQTCVFYTFRLFLFFFFFFFHSSLLHYLLNSRTFNPSACVSSHYQSHTTIYSPPSSTSWSRQSSPMPSTTTSSPPARRW